MKKVFIAIVIIFISFVLGAGSAYLAITYLGDAGWVKNGAWKTNLTLGSEEAGMYTRAYVALHALLSLRRSQTIYYYAEIDDLGNPLTSDCVFRIEGEPLNARWWSITAYGDDQFLIPNEEGRYSFNQGISNTGGYVIYLSRMPQEGNWLPTGDEKRLFLCLRLYNPADEYYDHPEAVKLPRIIRKECP